MENIPEGPFTDYKGKTWLRSATQGCGYTTVLKFLTRNPDFKGVEGKELELETKMKTLIHPNDISHLRQTLILAKATTSTF